MQRNSETIHRSKPEVQSLRSGWTSESGLRFQGCQVSSRFFSGLHADNCQKNLPLSWTLFTQYEKRPNKILSIHTKVRLLKTRVFEKLLQPKNGILFWTGSVSASVEIICKDYRSSQGVQLILLFYSHLLLSFSHERRKIWNLIIWWFDTRMNCNRGASVLKTSVLPSSTMHHMLFSLKSPFVRLCDKNYYLQYAADKDLGGYDIAQPYVYPLTLIKPKLTIKLSLFSNV